MSLFLDREASNLLVLKNYRDIKRSPEYDNFLNMLKERCSSLPPHKNIECKIADKGIHRIIREDVYRSVCEDNYADVIYVLTQVYLTHNNYCQGLSYIASFFCCFLDPVNVVKIIKYIIEIYGTNIWTSELNGLHVEIAVIDSIIDATCPEIKSYMNKHNLRLDFFIQKYLYSMFINVLDSDNIIKFFTGYFESGPEYCYKVIIAILKKLMTEDKGDIIEALKFFANIKKIPLIYPLPFIDVINIRKKADTRIKLMLTNIKDKEAQHDKNNDTDEDTASDTDEDTSAGVNAELNSLVISKIYT